MDFQCPILPFSQFDTEPAPPGEELSSFAESVIKSKLDSYSESGIIGLEYLVEISGSRLDDPTFKCLLCGTSLDEDGVIPDITSTKHRLEYLKRYFPKVHQKFAHVTNLNAWEEPTFELLLSVISRIETVKGRLEPTILRTKEAFDEKQMLEKINNGTHLRESEELNFRNFPDPFALYRHKLTHKDFGPVTCHDKGLAHIEDPNMKSLMSREIDRFREKMAEEKNNEKPNAENVMARLANMKKMLNKKEMAVYEKYKAMPSTGKDSAVGETGNPETESDAMVISDDDLETVDTGASRPRMAVSNRLRDRYNPHANTKHYNRERDRRPRSRSTSRDRARRYRRSPDRHQRRFSRSPSRERSHRRTRSRSRSKSPFTKLHYRWQRFSIALRVMRNAMDRKKEIFDKRPEDHPAYPQEWTVFWEQRYKELQDEGADADNYDYKEDWIPHWEKRVAAIFDDEEKQKISDLLKKYDLESEDEPKRAEGDAPKRRDEDVRRSREAGSLESIREVGSAEPADRDAGISISEYMMDYENFKSKHHSRAGEDDSKTDARSFSPPNRRGGGSMLGRTRSRSPSPRRLRRSRSRSRSRDRYNRGQRSWSRERRGHSRSQDTYLDDRRRSPDARFYGHEKISPVDDYSGISVLERMRDGGRARSPGRSSYIEDVQPNSILGCLRLLTALEDLLGSLGPQITAILTRSLALEKSREGMSNLLLEDKDVAAILEMTKEKLSGLLVAGLLNRPQENAVMTCLDRLQSLLAVATKKRPLNPPNLVANKLGGGGTTFEPIDEKTRLKKAFAEMLAKQLMQRGKADISEHDLHKLIFTIAEKTDLDDGTLAPPPPTPPPVYVQPQPNFSSYMTAGSYAAAPGVTKPVISEPSKPKFDEPNFDDSNLDEFDELTLEELRSLLSNFKNLSKSEQMDLVQYMRKIETTDPEKVKKLKEFSTSNKTIDKPPQSSSSNESRYKPPESKPDPPVGIITTKFKNPLASVIGAINAPPPPPPPPPPEDEPMYGRYQPVPPPPPDDYDYAPYPQSNPPMQPPYQGSQGLLGDYPTQHGGGYGNYNTYPQQGYGMNQGQSPHVGGGPPSSMPYQGANPLPPNPLFKQMGGYGGPMNYGGRY